MAKVTKENCMVTTHPELAAEFHPTKNDDLTPETVIAGTSKKLWWKCPKGDDHEWDATGSDRAHGKGCAVCAGRKVVPSNCMATTHPQLTAEFHPTLNDEISPFGVTSGSGKKIWWRCPIGHEYQASPEKRTRKSSPTGCPYCSGNKVSKENCLLAKFPEIAAEWHPTMNGRSFNRFLSGFQVWHWCFCLERLQHLLNISQLL